MSETYPPTWRSHHFRAMGSEIVLWLEVKELVTAATAFDEVEVLFADYEQALSRFRASSDLSLFNANAGVWTPVPSPLWEVTTKALELAALTAGYFDPTLLNALEVAGYVSDFELLKLGREANVSCHAGPTTGHWQQVEVDKGRRALCLPPGIRIDLGGIGKGYTAQIAVEHLCNYGPCLVDAGGDLVAGAAPQGFSGWPVAIDLPWSSSAEPVADSLCALWLADAALATSGIDYRRWQYEGRTAHHLIDPETGRPATTDLLTASVLTDDAADAEVWATATLVAGAGPGVAALLKERLVGLVVTQNNKIIATPEMHERLSGR